MCLRTPPSLTSLFRVLFSLWRLTLVRFLCSAQTPLYLQRSRWISLLHIEIMFLSYSSFEMCSKFSFVPASYDNSFVKKVICDG